MSPKKAQHRGHSDSRVERTLLRPREAAESAGVSRSKMYDLIKSGEVPSVRLGGHLRVPLEALRELAGAWRRRRDGAE